MKFHFETVNEYDALWQSVHDSILYWKKVRQDAQGKICLQANGAQTHYDEKYAIDQMVEHAELLKQIENTPHPEWDGEKYVTTQGPAKYHSHIVSQTLKLACGEEG